MNIVERVAQTALRHQAAAAGTSQLIHDHLKKAEPHFLMFLHEQSKTAWHQKKFEGPTSSGETIITWDGGAQGTLTLVAMAISDKVVDVSLHWADVDGMPEQPRMGRVSIDKVGDAKAVLGNLLAKYKGKTPWTKPKDKSAYLVAAAFLERKLAEQGKAAPKKVDDLHKEVKEGNPSYSDEQAWATAWSIYCKSVDPNGEHCHKSPGGYLKEGEELGSISRPTPSAAAEEDAPDESGWAPYEKHGEWNLLIYHPGGRRNLSYFMKNPSGGGGGSNDGTSVKSLVNMVIRRVGWSSPHINPHKKDKVWVSVLQFDGNDDWKPLKQWWEPVPKELLAPAVQPS